MKRTVFLMIIALISINTSNAQWWGGKKIKGNGDVTTVDRKTKAYDEVSLRGFMDVTLVAGDEGDITIKGESNLLEYIVVESDGDELEIYVEKSYNIQPSRGSKIIITVPFRDISAVKLSGSGDIVSKDVIKSPNFETGVSGSGNISLEIDSGDVDIRVSGSGDITIKGQAKELNCKVTGSGDVDAFELKTKKVEAYVTGSGDIGVYCTDSLKGRVTGSGDIDYKGNPERTDKKVTGSGDISKS